jgi:hypothetical protein
MRTARTVGLGFGIVFLLGLGAVSFSRAQQAEDKAAGPARVRSELREQVLTLRTEIDLLQLEFDADRATLLQLLTEISTADLLGIDHAAKVQQEMSELIEREAGEKKGEAQEVFKKLWAKELGAQNKTIKRKKQEFAKKARLLNERKLELAEAEAKFAAAKS